MAVVTGDDETVYVVSVHLLCSECRAPIKGWVNTPHWIRVEWISPDGECQVCAKERKEREQATKGSSAGLYR